MSRIFRSSCHSKQQRFFIWAYHIEHALHLCGNCKNAEEYVTQCSGARHHQENEEEKK